MREKILIDALEEIKEGKGRYNSDRFIHASNTIEDMKEIATKALSDYASQKDGLSKKEILSGLLADLSYNYENIKATHGLVHDLIEVAEKAMDIYKEQFQSPSSAPESGGEQYWKKRCELVEGMMDYMSYDSESTCDFSSWRSLKTKYDKLKATPPTKESGGDEKMMQELFDKKLDMIFPPTKDKEKDI